MWHSFDILSLPFVPIEDLATTPDCLKKGKWLLQKNAGVQLIFYLLPHSLLPGLFSLTDEAAENESDSEGIPDYSQLRMSSAKTLRTLEDVNTKLYIGTAVHIPTSKINIKQSLTTVQLAE